MGRPTSGYRNKENIRVPGTTTIIGRFKDSGALLWWAFEQGKAAQRGEINSLYDKRDQAADLGTQVHDLVEKHIKGEDVSLDGLDEKVVSGYSAYIKWESMTNLKIIEQEIPLVSERYQFGGTPDGIGMINGELCLVDWKTSSGIYPDYLIQLAAYKILWEENYPDRPITGGSHICRFDKEHADFAHHFYTDLDDATEQFILLRRAYEIDKRLKKRA